MVKCFPDVFFLKVFLQIGSLDLVKLLLIFDADVNAVDAQGQSIHDINKSSKRRCALFHIATYSLIHLFGTWIFLETVSQK